MSLRARILLLVLLATTVPAVVLGLYFVNDRERHIDEANQHLMGLAKQAVENLDDKVKGTVQLLHGLSRAQDIETTDKAACSEFLSRVLARFPQYTGLLTITPDGELHCDSLRTGRALNVSQRAYFRQVQATLAPAFDVVIGGLTGIAVLQVAYPVLDAQGRLRYVLLASLNLSEFAQSVVRAGPNHPLSVLIWDRNGILLVRKPDTPGAPLAGKDTSASELFRFAVSAQADAVASLPGPDEVDRVWAFGVMPEPRGGGARLAVGMLPDLLTADADQNLRNALLVLGGVSLLAFVVALYVAETGIRRHVGRIADVARRVGTGDLGARSGPPYPRGELGELMAVVDRTAEAVEAQQAEIVSSSASLRKLNRVLRVMNDINSLIVRVRSRDELFGQACRIAVDQGGLRMAMIAIVEGDPPVIMPVASAGMDEGFLGAIRDLLSSRERAAGTLVARAIRERKAVVSNASQDDPAATLRERHADAGVRSFAVLPLVVGSEAVGVLALYAKEAGFFDAEEMKLLADLAGDIAFAIDNIEKRERLDYLAYYDALTGLANRGLFLERLTQHLHIAASKVHQVGVLVVNMERFKNINESLGRSAGDALLRQVAQWMMREVGDASLLGRLGADTFAIVLPVAKRDGDVAPRVEKFLEAFKSHVFPVDDAALRVVLQGGVALFPDDGADAESLLDNAEAALRRAKARGDRYLFYALKMTQSQAGKLTLENQLRQALDRGEFLLHYQPKVSLASGKLTGAEALIRWNDPLKGMVPPMQFIPILEETGLIHEVGRWALRKSIEEYLRWRNAGLPAVRIAVNVSPVQLRDRDFLHEIRRIVGIDPHAASGLELEITESVFMDDFEQNIATLQAIRALGITVAIDDFGTGFSSLRYLAKLPVDRLKIDRSFVIDMTAGPEGLSLVSTIISLAHALRMKVVAEGVDAAEQSRILHMLNCDEMQGFLFSRPVSGDEFERKFLVASASDGARALDAIR